VISMDAIDDMDHMVDPTLGPGWTMVATPGSTMADPVSAITKTGGTMVAMSRSWVNHNRGPAATEIFGIA
jgi:hypothetical protein